MRGDKIELQLKCKLTGIYHLDMLKNWLDFGDCDLIFKITVLQRLPDFNQNHIVCTLFPEWMNLDQT